MNVGLWKILSYFLHQAPFLPFPFLFFWTKLHLTLFFPAQMATPGRRLCTSGKGARLRLGTFARGGSTSSPLWAWETPPRLSGLSQVRKKKSIPFDHKLLMAHSVKADWSLCRWHPACVAGQSCVCQNWLLKHKGSFTGRAIPSVLHDTTFMLGMIQLIWWRQEREGSINLVWWYGGVSYMKIWEALLLLLSGWTMIANDPKHIKQIEKMFLSDSLKKLPFIFSSNWFCVFKPMHSSSSHHIQ